MGEKNNNNNKGSMNNEEMLLSNEKVLKYANTSLGSQSCRDCKVVETQI